MSRGGTILPGTPPGDVPHMSDAAPARDIHAHLDDITTVGGHLTVRWTVDRHPFTTDYWYDTVDFDTLRTRHGDDAIDRLAFHIAMFEINKAVSWDVTHIDLGDHARHLTHELLDLWNAVVHGVWAQHRYQTDQPHRRPPAIVNTPTGTPGPSFPASTSDAVLWLCGGGKDSLLAAKLLRDAGRPIHSLVYTHSTYGTPRAQTALVDAVVDKVDPVKRHTIRMFDTFMDADHTGRIPADGHVLAAETPASLFASLPVCIAHDIPVQALGHERSANWGNLIWDATGEDVNHQWGKSLDAEDLLCGYARTHLWDGFTYASVLQPAYDTLIFAALGNDPDGIELTHSCNVAKPWCLTCPKCLYVWLGIAAWMDTETVTATFGPTNPLADPDNIPIVTQLVGLGDHTPFECVGRPEEAALFLTMAAANGWTGPVTRLLNDLGPLDTRAIAATHLTVHADTLRLAGDLRDRILDTFTNAQRFGTDHITETLTPALTTAA